MKKKIKVKTCFKKFHVSVMFIYQNYETIYSSSLPSSFKYLYYKLLKKHIPNISEEKVSSNIGVLYLVIMSSVKVVIMATVLLEITGNVPFGNCDQFLSEPKNRQATASLFKPKEHRGTFLIYHLLEERIFCLTSKF